MLLEVKGLTRHFGGLAAVSMLDLHVDHGETVGLIGPNGAGKSTVFNLITGFLRPTSGTIWFDGKNITGKKPHLNAKLGIGRAFQLAPVFRDFTVLQNVIASFHLNPKLRLWHAFFNTPTYRRNEAHILDRSLEILDLLGLGSVKHDLGRNLPHGHQKMLGIARALAIRPKLLLLDEPIGGMNPEEINFARTSIRKMQEQGVSILLVEHNMQIMDLCDRIIVINFGRKIAEGSMAEVRENKEVIQAYFGGGHAA
ncbi:MAG: ABC transporter ATP-binding protein [Deltaproteobacteria bacterium]|nr:ABC transporter ATP-binding protein [Deltaproteobacteria bacterium]